MFIKTDFGMKQGSVLSSHLFDIYRSMDVMVRLHVFMLANVLSLCYTQMIS